MSIEATLRRLEQQAEDERAKQRLKEFAQKPKLLVATLFSVTLDEMVEKRLIFPEDRQTIADKLKFSMLVTEQETLWETFETSEKPYFPKAVTIQNLGNPFRLCVRIEPEKAVFEDSHQLEIFKERIKDWIIPNHPNMAREEYLNVISAITALRACSPNGDPLPLLVLANFVGPHARVKCFPNGNPNELLVVPPAAQSPDDCWTKVSSCLARLFCCTPCCEESPEERRLLPRT